MKKKLPPGLIITLLEEKFGLKVKKHVKSYSVKCPFHDDQKASALVFPEINAFACMVCGIELKKRWAKATGKPFKEKPQKYYYIPAKAVAMLEGINKKGLSEKEWKEFLEEAKKQKVKKTYPKAPISINKKQPNQINPEDIWKLSENYICIESLKYLQKRKINGAILHKRNLIRFLSKETADKNKLLQLYYKDGYRILIPLYDYNGKTIVNLQVRKITENNKNLPKAKFIPGGMVTDFGLEDIKENRLATFFVEGSTDYLSLKSLGYKNVIGLTNINSSFSNSEKINLLKKLPKIIFMFYDKDEPGIKFASQIKKQIKEIDPTKILIPLHLLSKKTNIKDINDFITNTKNPYEKINKSLKTALNKLIKDNHQKKYILNNIEKLL